MLFASIDLPWQFWMLFGLIVVGIGLRQGMKKVKAFYGGLWSFATQHPVGSRATGAGLSYFLHRMFR